MAQMLLVNPKRKRKARKMTAKQAKYFAPRRKRSSGRRRKRAASAAPAPRRSRRKSARRSAAYTPARKTRRRSRRGVRSFLRSTSGSVGIKGTLVSAAVGGAGALALDVIYGYLPIPANLKTGAFAPLVKLGAVIGIGILASRFMRGRAGLVKTAVGAAVTIQAYNFLKAQVQARLPTVPLGEYVSGVGVYTGAGAFPQLGYVSPAQSFPDRLSGTGPGIPFNPEYQDEVF